MDQFFREGFEKISAAAPAKGIAEGVKKKLSKADWGSLFRSKPKPGMYANVKGRVPLNNAKLTPFQKAQGAWHDNPTPANLEAGHSKNFQKNQSHLDHAEVLPPPIPGQASKETARKSGLMRSRDSAPSGPGNPFSLKF